MVDITGKGKIEAADLLAESVEFPAEVITDLPAYVLNGAKHHSRARAHRPRDTQYCICGWPYQKALDNGAAMILSQSASKFYAKCEKCESR